MSEEEEDKKDPNNISDIFKKVVSTGISAAFMTEDTVKNILHDLPLPKDAVNGLIQNAKNSKEEFIKAVKTELREYLSKLDVQGEIDRIIENYDIEVNAKINLKSKNGSKTKAKVVKKTKKDE